LKLTLDKLLSSFGFNFSLRPYSQVAKEVIASVKKETLAAKKMLAAAVIMKMSAVKKLGSLHEMKVL